MTYYMQGEEATWHRDKDTFFISDVTFYAYAAIEQAQRVEIVYRKASDKLVTLTP